MVALGSESVVICKAAPAIVTLLVVVAFAPAASVTVTVTVYAPCDPAAGVPLIEVPENVRPAGSPLAEKEYGAWPPAAVNVAEYGTPTCRCRPTR